MIGPEIHRWVIATSLSPILPAFDAANMAETLIDELATIWNLIPGDSRMALLGMASVLKKHSDDGITCDIKAMAAMTRMREAP